MKIIIRNLARDTTQSELLALFQTHGNVQSCTVVMDQVTGGSKGFGFANMPVPHEAKAAIRALNGLELGGSKIRVKKADAVVASTQTSVDPVPMIDSGEQAAATLEAGKRPRIKKDGSPLGSKKARVFRKKS